MIFFFLFFQENNFYAGGSGKEAYCQNVTCKPGRECRVLFSGIGECVCVSRCPNKGRPICGSDGLRYRSHCELHRQACLKGRILLMSATWTHPSRLDTLLSQLFYCYVLYKVEIQSYFDTLIGFLKLLKRNEIDDVGICFILYLRHQLGSH